jgi:hypothetical protein
VTGGKEISATGLEWVASAVQVLGWSSSMARCPCASRVPNDGPSSNKGNIPFALADRAGLV